MTDKRLWDATPNAICLLLGGKREVFFKAMLAGCPTNTPSHLEVIS